jgi:hypothetical protein
MNTNLTLSDIMTIIGVFALVVVCTYLVILIRNFNAGVKVLTKVLEENKDNIDAALKDTPVITKNLVYITDMAKEEIRVVDNAISSIGETMEMTAAAASTIKNGFLGKVKKSVDIINMAGKLLFREKKK